VSAAPVSAAPVGSRSLEAVSAAWSRLAAVPSGGLEGQRERIEAIRALEDLKDAASAAQAELAVALVAAEVDAAGSACDAAARDDDGRAEVDRDDSQDGEPTRQLEASSRLRERKVAQARRSAIGQIALARRESPHRARTLVGVAEALVLEMPHTLAALRTGALNEYRATLLVRETACLDKESRASVDRELCADQRALRGLGTKRLVAAAKNGAYRRDPASVVKRAERSVAERCVSLRPAPGGMTYLTALVPLAQGVAMLATLRRAAESARATGDGRSHGQVMADTLVERVTGQASADAVPIAVQLVMSDATLLGAGHEPAVLDGAHLVPAQIARELVARASSPIDIPEAQAGAPPGSPPGAGSSDASASGPIGAWVRRLYADAGGNLVAMDSRARSFPDGLGRLLRVRDQGLCRTPWCDAPVAHLDHITPVASGGSTTAANGQGLCAGCNYTKQAHGWTQHVDRYAARHSVLTTTPTGQTYSSTASALPVPIGPSIATAPLYVIDILRSRPGDSPLEIALTHGF